MNPVSRTVMDVYYSLVGSWISQFSTDRKRVLRAASFLGSLRSRVGYIGPKKSRRIFIEHMARAAPHLSTSEIQELLNRFWFYHQLRFLDLFVVQKNRRESLGDIIEFQGLENLDSALSVGKGVIITTLHLGDARFCHVGLGWKGYPLTLLSARYDDYGKKAKETRLNSSLKYHNVRFLDRSLRWVFRDLSRGSSIFMAVSGYGGAKGYPSEFMNQELVFSSALARISFQAKVPIVPAVDLVDDKGTHVIKLYPAVTTPQEAEEMIHCTGRLVSIFEREALLSLSQLDWIWYVIRCQERAGEVEAYEEGRILRADETPRRMTSQ